MNETIIETTFSVLYFWSFILHVCFYKIFMYKVFYVTLKCIALKHSFGNIINIQLNYTLRSNSKLKIYLKQL